MSGFRMGLGCCDCGPPCRYSLCVRAVGRCRQMLSGFPRYVASTITFDGPNGEHYEIATGGGGDTIAQACISEPAIGEWTITATADGFQDATATATVTECVSQTVAVPLCPNKVTVYVDVGGCRPPRACGPISISLDGHGVITPPASTDYWDHHPGMVPFEVDLSGVTLDANCEALSWTATATPPESTGMEPVTSSGLGYGSCVGPWIVCNFDVPDDKVCCDGVLYPKEFEFSDDWGACTLTHGTPSSFRPDWNPYFGILTLDQIAPWIGSYSFECDNACENEPCGSSPYVGVYSGRMTVSVTIAATCPGGTVYKLYALRTSCVTGEPCLHSFEESGVGSCRLEGDFNSDPCDSAVFASGSWVSPFQNSDCMKAKPCVAGDWTITG